jgi:hypothetical protein
LTRPRSTGESAPTAALGAHLKEERVLLDVRTYKTLPGRVPAQLEIYKKYGYPVQLRYMGEPLCYAVAESGELNTFTHIWVYASAADREEKRARMMKDPDWAVYLAENVKGGHLISQETCLMTPVGFAPPIPMPKIHT